MTRVFVQGGGACSIVQTFRLWTVHQSLLLVTHIAGFPPLPGHTEDKVSQFPVQLDKAVQLTLSFVTFRLNPLKAGLQLFSPPVPAHVNPEASC